MVNRFRVPARPTRVLMVDDDGSSASGCVDGSRASNGWCRRLRTGATPSPVSRTRKPDVILLDLMMPEMDGFAVVAALQKEPRWRDIPVVVITALDLDADDRERLNSGVQSVLVKETFRPAESGRAHPPAWRAASPRSAARWKRHRDQSALRRRQRRQRLYAQDAARATRRISRCMTAEDGEKGCAMARPSDPTSS